MSTYQSNREALLFVATDLDASDKTVPRHIRASITSAVMGVPLSANEAYELHTWASEAYRGAWGHVAMVAHAIDCDRGEDGADHAHTAKLIELCAKQIALPL